MTAMEISRKPRRASRWGILLFLAENLEIWQKFVSNFLSPDARDFLFLFEKTFPSARTTRRPAAEQLFLFSKKKPSASTNHRGGEIRFRDGCSFRNPHRLQKMRRACRGNFARCKREARLPALFRYQLRFWNGKVDLFLP
jgi:hypothetical protein